MGIHEPGTYTRFLAADMGLRCVCLKGIPSKMQETVVAAYSSGD
jgi:hypothetical protein